MREGNEKAKENYYFISDMSFKQKVANKDFIEHREVAEGCSYGTCMQELERIKSAGKIPIIEVDVEGAIEINR